MPRNLDRRLELLFPAEDAESKKRLIEALDLYFRDNTKAWALQADGRWERIDAGKSKRIRAQEVLCERAITSEDILMKAMPRELKPQRPRPTPEAKKP